MSNTLVKYPSRKKIMMNVILILLIIGSISILTGTLIPHIKISDRLKELRTIQEDDRLMHNNFIALHEQLPNIMDCNSLIDKNIQIEHNIYSTLSIGIDEVKYHLYSHIHPHRIGDYYGNMIVRYNNTIDELRLKKAITTCYEGHMVTLDENFNLIVSGVDPLTLRAGIPLISYNPEDVWTEMIYKNDITSVLVRSTGLTTSDTFMYFYNYTNTDLPSEYCLVSVAPVLFNRVTTKIYIRHYTGEYHVDITLNFKIVDEILYPYREICFDFKNNTPYIQYGSRVFYNTRRYRIDLT